jgi:hypothetical protein
MANNGQEYITRTMGQFGDLISGRARAFCHDMLATLLATGDVPIPYPNGAFIKANQWLVHAPHPQKIMQHDKSFWTLALAINKHLALLNKYNKATFEMFGKMLFC